MPANDSFWNPLQVLAWIAARDSGLVQKFSEDEPAGSFLADTHHRIPGLTFHYDRGPHQPTHFTRSDMSEGDHPLATLGEASADRPDTMYLSFWLSHPDSQPIVVSLPEARALLDDALKAGKLIFTGFSPQHAERREIPALAWLDLFLDPNRDHATNGDGLILWKRLFARRQDVLGRWPEAIETETVVPELGPEKHKLAKEDRVGKKISKTIQQIQRYKPSVTAADAREVAHKMCKAGLATEFSEETVRKIIAGNYKQMRERGITPPWVAVAR